MAQLSDTAGEIIVVTGATTDANANGTYTYVSTGLYTGGTLGTYDIFLDSATAPTVVVLRDAGDLTVYTADNPSVPLGAYTPASELTLVRYPAAPSTVVVGGASQLSDVSGESVVVTGATTDADAIDTYDWVSTGLYTGTANGFDLVDTGSAWIISDAVDATVYTADNYSSPLGDYTPADTGMTINRYHTAPVPSPV